MLVTLLVLFSCRTPLGPFPDTAADTSYGTSADTSRDTAPPCTPRRIVATDIDATLTLSNNEWKAQTEDPTYDPILRPDADALMQTYAEKGYTILYITARSETYTLSDGRTAFQVTDDWLRAHAFPMADDAVHLAPQWYDNSADVVAYKAGVLDARAAEGWVTDWGYGNATTDIDAWLQAGVAADHAFLVGSLAGSMEVSAIPDADAYTNHLAEHMPNVPEAACDGE